jgi:hypothetical protein
LGLETRLDDATQISSHHPRRQRGRQMKRFAVWAFYGIGALAILYLALYAYAAFTGRALQPGDPIHIFRKPDAPDYSAARDGDFA